MDKFPAFKLYNEVALSLIIYVCRQINITTKKIIDPGSFEQHSILKGTGFNAETVFHVHCTRLKYHMVEDWGPGLLTAHESYHMFSTHFSLCNVTVF